MRRLMTPFPRGSRIDAASELHDELATWDTIVADAAIALDRGSAVERGALDVAAGLLELRAKLESQLREAEEVRDRAASYLERLKLLEEVEALVESQLGQD